MSECSFSQRKLRVFLVEDHHIMRRGLGSLLTTEMGVEIVGEAADGIEALEKLPECRPEAVIMDISMPRMNGIEATRRIKLRYPNLWVLILSMFNNPTLVSQSLQVGASGYILKDSMIEELALALQTVMAGGVFVSPQIKSQGLDGLSIPNPTPADEELTKREFEVLQALANGRTVAQIAADLCVSIYTIYTHIANLKRKLQLNNQAELIRYGIEHHLIHANQDPLSSSW